GKFETTRPTDCTRPAAPAADGYARGSSPTSSACAACRRRERYPRPPAPRSRIDIPPSTRSGIGTDDMLVVSTSGATCPGSSEPGSVPPFEPPFPLPPVPLLPSPVEPPPGWRAQSFAEPSAVGSQPP